MAAGLSVKGEAGYFFLLIRGKHRLVSAAFAVLLSRVSCWLKI